MPTTKQQLDRFAAGRGPRPWVKPPKVPDAVRDYLPKLKGAWKEHDEEWNKWARKQQTLT